MALGKLKLLLKNPSLKYLKFRCYAQKYQYETPETYRNAFYLANASRVNTTKWFIHNSLGVIYQDIEEELKCKGYSVSDSVACRKISSIIKILEPCNNCIDIQLPVKRGSSAYEIFRAEHRVNIKEGLCLGGIEMLRAHGGILVFPKDLEQEELQKNVETYATQLFKKGFCGESTNIIKPDVNCGSTNESKWIIAVNSKVTGGMGNACSVGKPKPVLLSGVQNHEKAVAQGIFFGLDVFLQNREIKEKIGVEVGRRKKTCMQHANMQMVSTQKRVILDVDPGTDDAFALLVLLHAEKLGLAKIEAIVCSNGNASLENTSKNLVRLLEVLNRTDIPVYKGVIDVIIPSGEVLQEYFGKDGFGDLEHETEPNMGIIRKESAPAAMRNLVINNPGEITLVCLGPLTNTALTMKLYDDFAPNIKEIFIMGGNTAAVGNAVKTAEFNFYADPEAAVIVLENAQCPVTIAPWETCIDTRITLKWRFEVLGRSKQSPFMDLLNAADQSIFGKNDPDSLYYPCDVFLVIAMLYPKEMIMDQKKYYATVELNGSHTRGQVVLDHLNETEPNVVMLIKLNDDFAKQILLKAAEETY